MVARLWWKEARLFWPIAAFLAVVSVAAQWLVIYLLRQGGPDRRAAGPGPRLDLPLRVRGRRGEPCRRAREPHAAAARRASRRAVAALGGEVVVRRWARRCSWGYRCWPGMRTSRRIRGTMLRPRNAVVLGGLVALLQVLGWGLFWSAVCGQALTAAVLAVCSAGLMLPLLDPGLNFRLDPAAPWLTRSLAAWPRGASAFFLSGPALPAGRSSRGEPSTRSA